MQPYQEYPKMVRHPETGVDATARDATHEASLAEQGFVGPASDAAAFERAQAAPFRPNFVAEEWPKWIDGKLVDPRPQPATFQEYPKALSPPDGADQIVVASAEEERAALDRWTAPARRAPKTAAAPATDAATVAAA